MKRKTVAIILSLATAFMLVGCGETEPVKENTPVATEAPTEVKEEPAEITEAPAEITEAPAEITEAPADPEPASGVAAFLGGEVKAVVDEGVALGYNDFEKESIGEEFTFTELTDFLCNPSEGVTYNPTIYSYVMEKDGESVLLIKYQNMDIYDQGDDSFVVFAISEKADGLHISYETESWCRNDVQIYAEGVIASGGSAGAGDNIYTEGYIGSDGYYYEISYGEECYPGWIGSLFAYASYSFGYSFGTEVVDKAYEVDSEGAMVAFYRVNGALYATYDGESTEALDSLVSLSEEEFLEWLTPSEIVERTHAAWEEVMPGFDWLTLNPVPWEEVM